MVLLARHDVEPDGDRTLLALLSDGLCDAWVRGARWLGLGWSRYFRNDRHDGGHAGKTADREQREFRAG